MDGATDVAAQINQGTAQPGVLWVPSSPLQARIGSPIVLGDGAVFRGNGPKASVIGAQAGFAGAAMVTNQRNDGSQEFAWVADLKLAGSHVAPTGVLVDTLYANSGLSGVLCNQCTSDGIVIKSSTVSQGPLYLRDVWSTGHGGDSVRVDATTGGMRGLWIENLTAESPPDGFACLRLVATGGRMFGVHILGLHMETNISGSVGLILDGVTVLSATNITATASGGGWWSDVIQIKGQSHGIDLRSIFARPSNVKGSLINDMTNGKTIPVPASGYLSEYTL